MNDEHYMRHALDQAHLAAKNNEVPVGAVLVYDDEIIASAYNQPIRLNDPTAHAEVMVVREAGKKLNNYRLINSTLYVTLEPCMMCVSAMVHARIARCVFGASDPKSGALVTKFNGMKLEMFNHRFDITQDVLTKECSDILKDFFRERR